MNDYIRRAVKFILYLAVIFVIVLVLFPLIMGRKPDFAINDILHNQRMTMFLIFILIYALIYPVVAYVKIKRHLNGTFAENRNIFEKAFETLQYVKTEETPDRIIYRKKSKFARFIQWYEDSVVVSIDENPVIIAGLRKSATGVDRIIDHLLLKAAE